MKPRLSCSWVDLEGAEDVACLPAFEEAENGEGDGKEEHRPPAEDERVAEDEEDHAGYPEEDDADVEQGDEVVDAGDELREDAGLVAGRVGAEPFEHPPRPAGALAQKPIELLGDDREAERDGLVLDEAA